MTETIRIECPHCSTRLNAKNPSIYGKKVRCPKCAESFVTEAPPLADEDNFLDNLNSFGDSFGETLPSAKLPAAPARTKSGRKSPAEQESERSDERPKKKRKPRAAQGNTLPWITWPLFGFGGGLVAAAIWVAVGYFFQREVGYIAWVVGLCVGLGVRIAAGDREGIGAGLTAIAISICVILGSKFTVAYLVTAKFVNMAADAEADEESTKFFLAMQIADEEPGQGAKGGAKEAENDLANATTFQELPKEVREKTENRWKQMSAAEKKEFQNKMLGVQQIPPLFIAFLAFFASFRKLDLLWFGLASFTAFRVGSGSFGSS
jgi:predicted Zn finger-like uncharacterized protein